LAKILFVNIPAHGHINPTLGFVKELINRGNQVSYMSTEKFRKTIEATGARLIPYKLRFDPDSIVLNTFKFKLLRGTIDMFREMYSLALENGSQYDYIIHDSLFFAGENLSKLLGKPTICSVSTFALSEKVIEALTKFDVVEIPFAKRLIECRINRDLGNALDMHIHDYKKLFINRYSFNIVYTSNYFQPYGKTFGENFKFIGPSITDRIENTELPLDKLQNKKVVYISLGTVNNKMITFYKNCLKAFSNMDIMFIMSIGNRTKISSLGKIPDNFLVMNYAPQLEVLKLADVFITHGGMNSASEGLFYGVPLIVIPHSSDQPIVAKRVAELKAGLHIPKDKATPEILRDSVVNVLENENYKKNACIIQKSFKEAGGYDKAVDYISEYLKNWHAQHIL